MAPAAEQLAGTVTFPLRCCELGLPFAFLGVVLRLLDFDERAPAGVLVLSPPVVVRGGRPVGGALHVAVVGLSELARPVAAPPVAPVLVHLVVEGVVHLAPSKGVSTEQAA